MLVDDIEINRVILKGILENDYEIVEAADGAEALDMLLSENTMISLVVLDIIMPVMDGYELLQLMKRHVRTESIPVIMISAEDASVHESRALSLGAVDFIPTPFNPDVVRIRITNHLRLKNYNETIENMAEKKAAQLINTREKVLETMANIIEYRDSESGLHVKRTKSLMGILLNHVCNERKYGFDISQYDQKLFLKSVPLHDIGKIAIPDRILQKPGRLSTEEYDIIKTHVTIGSDIILLLLQDDHDGYMSFCYDVCRYHHERWDGTGYPEGLSGKDIPVPARFMSIVDVYDALVFSRIYKPPFSHEKAVEIIAEGMSGQFDPILVMAFLEVEGEFEEMKKSEEALLPSQ